MVRKLYLSLVTIAAFVIAPFATLHAQSWISGFLRDTSGAIYITCRSTPNPSDKWSGGFRRDTSGNVAVQGCVGGSTPTPSPSPTPPVTFEGITPLLAYIAQSTAAGPGYDPGPTVDQSVLYIAQFTWGDIGGEDATVRNTDCPASQSNCHPMGYVSLAWTQCDSSLQEAWWSAAYNGGALTDQDEVMHLQGTTHTFANRYYLTTGGSCDTTGGNTGTGIILPNPGNAASNAIWQSVYFASPSYINNDTHVWTMADNESYGRESTATSNGTAYAQEDEVAQASGHSPAVWAQLKATQANYFSAYPMDYNDFGVGGGVYVGNNRCTSLSCPVGSSGTGNDGIYNWTIDSQDFCSALTGTNLKDNIHEKPFASIIGGVLIGYRDNVKVVVNSDSQAWVNCPNQNIEWLNFTSLNGTTDAPALRYENVVVQGLAEPNGFAGSRSQKQIVQWQYSTARNNVQLAVMPENYLVFTNASGFGATVNPFKWGGTGANGTDDSNGCQAGATPSTGGMVDVTIQATCGVDGVDGLGYNVGVQAREYNDCYQAGFDKGKCAVVLNTGNNSIAQSYLSAALPNWGAYKHIWQYSGTGPMNVDPLSGGTICTTANGCNGAIGTPAAIPATLPPCAWANMATSAVCAWVLTSW